RRCAQWPLSGRSGAAVRAHPVGTVERVAGHRAQGDRPAGGPGPGGAPSRFRQLYRAAHRAAVVQPHQFFGATAAARPHSRLALAQARHRCADAGGAAEPGPVAVFQGGAAGAPAPGGRCGDGVRGVGVAANRAERPERGRQLAVSVSGQHQQGAGPRPAAHPGDERVGRAGQAAGRAGRAGAAVHHAYCLSGNWRGDGADPFVLP
ncbi:Fatty acyl-responsive regulator, putative, partial [Ricinus communis]